MVKLTISQHWFRKGLGAEWRQAIIWNNDDSIRWRIYAALGGDESTLEVSKYIAKFNNRDPKNVPWSMKTSFYITDSHKNVETMCDI